MFSILSKFQRGNNPRLDGCTIDLYLSLFALLGGDPLKVVEEVRIFGKVFGSSNSTFIARIPKVNKPRTFDDFKPISLCNCAYKIISKVLFVRLKKLLSDFISLE